MNIFSPIKSFYQKARYDWQTTQGSQKIRTALAEQSLAAQTKDEAYNGKVSQLEHEIAGADSKIAQQRQLLKTGPIDLASLSEKALDSSLFQQTNEALLDAAGDINMQPLMQQNQLLLKRIEVLEQLLMENIDTKKWQGKKTIELSNLVAEKNKMTQNLSGLKREYTQEMIRSNRKLQNEILGDIQVFQKEKLNAIMTKLTGEAMKAGVADKSLRLAASRLLSQLIKNPNETQAAVQALSKVMAGGRLSEAGNRVYADLLATLQSEGMAQAQKQAASATNHKEVAEMMAWAGSYSSTERVPEEWTQNSRYNYLFVVVGSFMGAKDAVEAVTKQTLERLQNEQSYFQKYVSQGDQGNAQAPLTRSKSVGELSVPV